MRFGVKLIGFFIFLDILLTLSNTYLFFQLKFDNSYKDMTICASIYLIIHFPLVTSLIQFIRNSIIDSNQTRRLLLRACMLCFFSEFLTLIFWIIVFLIPSIKYPNTFIAIRISG